MLVIEWDGDDLWNLLSLPNPELYRLYEQFYRGNRKERRETLRRVANTKRNYYRTGKIVMPERSEPYDPALEPERIANRRSRLAKNLAGKALDVTVITVPVEHLPYHEKLQQALDDEGALTKARFSDYEMGYKDSDGEAQTHKLHASRFEVAFETEPKWPIPTRVESVKLRKKESLKQKPFKTCMVFPDVQIPFESEEALQVALRVLQDVKPDRVVFLGDLLDLNAWSRFDQQPEWATATQSALVKAHQLLASIRKALPSADIDVLAGNHEERMPKVMLQNAKAAYGLKRANQLENWPVMSVPYLLALDDLDINYHPGYPANRLWLNPNLQIRHGNKTQKKGAGVRSTSAAEKVSTITGHDHRISSFITTINTYDGAEQIHTYGAGCLCRLDGHVPSYHSGKDLSGAPITQYEDWNQGFVIAHYDEENFHVEQVPINLNHQAMYQGRVYG